MTQDHNFNLLRYAASSGHTVLVRELEDLSSIKRVLFLPPLRRRDGDGVVDETVVFAGYEVAWEEHEFTAIVASVSGRVITGRSEAGSIS